MNAAAINDKIKEMMQLKKERTSAYKANEQEILSNPNLLAILKKFIEFRLGRSHIKPPISKIIECYELCDCLLSGIEGFEDRKSDLQDFCFTEGWENQLKAAKNNTIHTFCHDLMGECSRRLGEEPEYQMFKEKCGKK